MPSTSQGRSQVRAPPPFLLHQNLSAFPPGMLFLPQGYTRSQRESEDPSHRIGKRSGSNPQVGLSQTVLSIW